MTQPQVFYLLIPAAYLLGSLPMGLFVGLAKGIDPRTSGSGNIGATNLGRLLGTKYFALVFALDFLKGALPVLIAGWLLNFHPADRTGYCLWIATALAAILGHSFSIFLGFKGGKGVSTSGGVVLAVFPYLAIPSALALVIFLVVLRTTRFMSLASMIGSAAIPIAYIAIGLAQGWPILSEQTPVLGLSLLIPTLIIYKHRTNIQRLRAGTESRFKVKEKCA
jgi:glycerol-3-phosphate acyltransferase PlsY